MQHLDILEAPCEALRSALRDANAPERLLLEERLSDFDTVATARELMRPVHEESLRCRASAECLRLTAAEATAVASVAAWLERTIPVDAAPPANANGFLAHWLATALAARMFAASEPRLDVQPGDAFLAGLLHDIGKAAICAVFPRGYRRIVARNQELRGDLIDQERSFLGMDHTTAGRYLAERWALPRSVRETIWLHHLSSEVLPGAVARPHLLKLIRLADTLAREAHIGFSGNYRLTESSAELAERLAMDAAFPAECSKTLAEETEYLMRRVLRRREQPANAASRTDSLAGRRANTGSASLREHRVLGAIHEFDRSCGDAPDLRIVMQALAVGVATVLQRRNVCVFVLDHTAILSFVTFDRKSGVRENIPQLERSISAEDLLALSTSSAEIIPSPRSIREQLVDALREDGFGGWWLIPLRRGSTVLGGVLIAGESEDEESGWRVEADLRMLRDHATRMLGLVLDCRSAQRLSDDLAEANRRTQHMQHELLRNKALSMIAEMAAGAGHEMNSPLAVISGRAQMLARQFDDSEVRRSLEIISEKAHECSQIVSDLMEFARPRPPQPVSADLAQWIRESTAAWAAEIALPPSRLTVSVPDTLPAVLCDLDQIGAVMRELLRNAANAIAMNGGQIFIAGRVSPLGDGVEISIRDTGCGMSSAVSQRAFDPFYSHREAGRGRGLGLPRVHRIIEAHGGRVWLESTSDEGTIARFFLPFRGAAEQAQPHATRRVS